MICDTTRARHCLRSHHIVHIVHPENGASRATHHGCDTAARGQDVVAIVAHQGIAQVVAGQAYLTSTEYRSHAVRQRRLGDELGHYILKRRQQTFRDLHRNTPGKQLRISEAGTVGKTDQIDRPMVQVVDIERQSD